MFKTHIQCTHVSMLVYFADITADGKIAVSSNMDGSIRFYDVVKGYVDPLFFLGKHWRISIISADICVIFGTQRPQRLEMFKYIHIYFHLFIHHTICFRPNGSANFHFHMDCLVLVQFSLSYDRKQIASINKAPSSVWSIA